MLLHSSSAIPPGNKQSEKMSRCPDGILQSDKNDIRSGGVVFLGDIHADVCDHFE